MYYTCYYKNRDKSGRILSYTLRNENTYEFMEVKSDELRVAMMNNRVIVFNLKLTSDNKIIDSPNIDMYNNTSSLELVERVKSLSLIKPEFEDQIYSSNDYNTEGKKNVLKNRVKRDSIFNSGKGIFAFFSRENSKLRSEDLNKSSYNYDPVKGGYKKRAINENDTLSSEI